jgi:hypothetical protein
LRIAPKFAIASSRCLRASVILTVVIIVVLSCVGPARRDRLASADVKDPPPAPHRR